MRGVGITRPAGRDRRSRSPASRCWSTCGRRSAARSRSRPRATASRSPSPTPDGSGPRPTCGSPACASGRVGFSTRRAGNATQAVVELDAPLRTAATPTRGRSCARRPPLGETFIELTPGSRAPAQKIADGGPAARGPGRRRGKLFDEALSAFDPGDPARAAAWPRRPGRRPSTSRGPDLNAGELGLLLATEVEATQTAARPRQPARRGALGSCIGLRRGPLQAVATARRRSRSLIADGDRLFAVTARRSRGVRETLRALPGPRARGRRGDRRRGGHLYDRRTLQDLTPAVREIGPLLRASDRAAPVAEALLRELPLVYAARREGLPDLDRVITAARPLIGALDPAAHDLDPMLSDLRRYRQELTSSWAVTAATSQASTVSVGGKRTHYVRLVPNLTNESPTVHAEREPSNRHNPYPEPRWLDKLAGRPGGLRLQQRGQRVDDPRARRRHAAVPGAQTDGFPRLSRTPP